MKRKAGFYFVILGILINFSLLNFYFLKQGYIFRRIKISSGIVIKEVPAQNHLAKVTLLNLAYLLGEELGPLTGKELKERADKINLAPETIKLIAEGIKSKEIKRGLIMALIQQVLDQAKLEISFSDLNYGTLSILSDAIREELLFTLTPQDVKELDGSYIFLVKERVPERLIKPWDKTREDKVEFYKELGIKNPEKARIKSLRIMDINPYFVKFRLEKLEKFFEQRCNYDGRRAKEKAVKYLDLLAHDINVIEKKANAIDRLVKEKGLKVSYKKEDGIEIVDPNILTAYPSTVEENLTLLRENGIDEIKNYKLLYEVSTSKLSTNINFLKKIGMPLQVSLIRTPVLRLQNNWLILKMLGAKITPANLKMKTEETLIPKLRKGEIKISSMYNSTQMEILFSNLEGFLPTQEEFYKWWLRAEENLDLALAELLSEEEFEQWQVTADPKYIYKAMQKKAIEIYRENFGFEGLGEIPPPSWALFSLLTYINITTKLGSALIDFCQQCLLKGDSIGEEPLEEIIDDLAQKYKLNSTEKEKLEEIVRKERSFIPVPEE